MIKILHILWSGSFGGIQRLVFDLSVSQKQNPELESSVLICKNGGNLQKEMDSSGVMCHVLGLKSGYDFRLSKHKELKKLYHEYDILHFHDFNYLAIITGLLTNKKKVYTTHSVYGSNRKKKFSNSFNKFFLKVFLKYFPDFITYNSNYTKNYFKKHFRIITKNSRVVYNGIDLPDYNIQYQSPVSLNLKDQFVVGTSSRFIKWKRIDILVKTFFDFQKDKETVLLLVGDGDEKQRLIELVEELGMKEKVIFTGYQSNIADYQALMDVCVFPSATETFGLVAIETMSLGKPTIVFKDGGGIAEIVEKNEAYNVVEAQENLLQRLEYYYNNIDSEELVEKRKQFAGSFNVKVMENNFFDIYNQIIKK